MNIVNVCFINKDSQIATYALLESEAESLQEEVMYSDSIKFNNHKRISGEFEETVVLHSVQSYSKITFSKPLAVLPRPNKS